MRINHPVLRLSLIVIAIITPLIFAGYSHYQRNHFRCEAHMIIVDDDSVVDVMTNYNFKGNAGTLRSSGEYLKNDASQVAISNQISFAFWREGGDVIMVSNDTNELPKKSEPYRLNIPDFYHSRDRGIRIKITPAHSAGYFFSYSNTPLFYCAKG